MTPQERLALALQYQKQRDLGSVLPSMPDPNAPAVEPKQSFLGRLSERASGVGYGLGEQVEGLGQMVRHPIDTLHSLAVGAGKAMDNPAAAGRALVQGVKESANQAVSSPFNMGRAVGANVSLNPRKLAAMLESPQIAEMTVYHGTPHQFPATKANPLGEFDASKIGTGEGAQAYGHGIYVAESPDVAKVYQSAQSPSARKATMVLQASDGNVDKAIELMKKEVAVMSEHKDAPYLRQGAYEETQDALNHLQQMKKGKASEIGSFYTVDLPDEHIERMLDWDKPLSEQPEAVRKAFAKADERARFGPLKKNAPILDPEEKHLRGQDAYRALANALSETGVIRRGSTAVDGSDKAVSEYLRQLGIPGIKYLDAGSRGQGGSGTRNFVIFPGEEKNLKILERK